MKEKYKDPLKVNIKEVAKDVVKGAVVLGIGVPLLVGLSDIIGGLND